MSTVPLARQLAAQRPPQRVISLYMDLDPDQFATPPARESQVVSLIDGAARALEQDSELSHDELVVAREDLERLRRYLLSDEPPFQGARSLAVFCSGAELFEAVALRRPVAPGVTIAPTPHIAPLLEAGDGGGWCVALVSRGDARILTGSPERLRERERDDDDVHGQHSQGGWSQARYERSVEQDVDRHLRDVAEALHRRWRTERFERLVLGGPQEIVPRFEALLHPELRERLVPERLSLDVSVSGPDDVQDALGQLAEEVERTEERHALERLADGLGAGGRAADGLRDTLNALNERRVETLLLTPEFDTAGARCPSCGMLYGEPGGSCAADGTRLEAQEHLRDALIEAALGQDARIMVMRHDGGLGPHGGIAALLRF